MKLLAHRGQWWPTPARQNCPEAVADALASGWGVEVDVWSVRDRRLVLRHDESSGEHELTLPVLDRPIRASTPLFLHAKGGNDGFPERLFDAIRVGGWLDSTYVFCSPSNDAMLARMKAASVAVQTLVTVDDLDGLNVLLDLPEALGGADGAWLEQPEENWVSREVIALLHSVEKSVWVVSPELHGRTLDLAWLDAWSGADGLVTDYPHLIERVLNRTDPVVHPKEPWWQ